MRFIERLAALRARAASPANTVAAPPSAPSLPAVAAAVTTLDEFERHLAFYERRFRDLAMRRARNAAELKLIRAGWDDPSIRAVIDEVVAGRKSATAVAIELGWRKPKSPLQELCSAWKRASPSQRAEFRAFMAAPVPTPEAGS